MSDDDHFTTGLGVSCKSLAIYANTLLFRLKVTQLREHGNYEEAMPFNIFQNRKKMGYVQVEQLLTVWSSSKQDDQLEHTYSRYEICGIA